MPLIQKTPKIHILPNMFTAGNLLFGFIAILFFFDHAPINEDGVFGELGVFGKLGPIRMGILCILAAGILDLLDGRVARLRGQETPFGREFDSLADIVSFGVAPALLLMNIVLIDFVDKVGVIIACVYLCCGAMRLARFNVLSTEQKSESSGEFIGLPIPAAAIVISSLTLFLLWMNDGDHAIGKWRFVLPVLMVLMSLLMISALPYPSFKRLNMRTKRSIPWVIVATLLLLFTAAYWQVMPAVLAMAYLLYGLARPWVSLRLRREIEETPEDEDDEDEDDEIEIEVQVLETGATDSEEAESP